MRRALSTWWVWALLGATAGFLASRLLEGLWEIAALVVFVLIIGAAYVWMKGGQHRIGGR